MKIKFYLLQNHHPFKAEQTTIPTYTQLLSHAHMCTVSLPSFTTHQLSPRPYQLDRNAQLSQQQSGPGAPAHTQLGLQQKPTYREALTPPSANCLLHPDCKPAAAYILHLSAPVRNLLLLKNSPDPQSPPQQPKLIATPHPPSPGFAKLQNPHVCAL